MEKQTQSYGFAITKDDKVIAALGVLYPNSMETPEYRNSMLKYSRTAAREISRRIGLDNQTYPGE